MKRILFFILMLFCVPALAQNTGVENKLKSKYSLVQYHNECGGWYFISYNQSGQQLYGFADNKGNVVATDASQYKIHPGYIELYLLDAQKKQEHDQWLADCKVYEASHNEYLKVNKKYEAELSAYNVKYQAAEKEADARWRRAREVAKQKAEREAAQLQQQTSQGATWVAILGGVVGGVSVAASVEAVKYEPYLEQVLAERDLLVKPSKPYNPKPIKPTEPPTGYYWQSYSLRQPDRYDFIDFASISETGSFADVSREGKWGLVDSRMNEIIPCVNTEKVLKKKYDDGMFLIKSSGKYGVINSTAKYILPMEFGSIDRYASRFKVSKSNRFGLYSITGKEIIPCEFEKMDQQHGYWLVVKDELWGIYSGDYDELYPCQFQDARLVSNNGKLMLYNKNKGLWGVIDFLAGTELLPNNYSSIEFSNHKGVGSFYKVCSDSKYGIYSSTGVIIIPCSYTNIYIKNVAEKTMIEVVDGQNVGLYDTAGILILPTDRYSGYTHQDSYYVVSNIDKKVGVCDLYGNELIPCKYTSLEYNDKLHGFIASKGRMKGLVSMRGREIFPFLNTEIIELSPLCPDILVVNNGELNGYGAIDYAGNIVVPMKNKYKNLTKKVDSAIKKYPDIKQKSTENKDMLYDDMSFVEVVESQTLKERQSFSFFAQNYVERVVGEWQKKGEFEKVEDWRKRVNNNTLNQRVYALTKEAQALYIDEYTKIAPSDTPRIIGSYDPDNETYRVSTSYSDEDILIKVDSKDAMEFKSSFNSLKKQPIFFVENDRVGLAEYVFSMPDGTKYKYSNQASLTYAVADVKYNLESIEIDRTALGANQPRGKQTISTASFAFGTSDVDVNIPVSETLKPNTFALIIANENYQNERKVDYAYNDGQVLKDYCQKTLGIPSENIHFRPDATLNNMKFEVGWLKTVTKAFPDAQILFYYAGHGMPDDYSRESYLLPVDGYGSDIKTTGYKLSDLYASLGELPADNVLVMLDACFSGADRTGEVLNNVRAARVVPKKDKPAGNVVVFSATTDQQVAHPYADESHGLFTYYLLKKLQETNGKVSYGEWFDYIKTKVAQKASVVNNKEQTPTVTPSPSILNKWKTIEL